jgi:hypothetical protein
MTISSRPSISGGNATMPPLPVAPSNVSSGPMSTSSPPPGIEQPSSRGKPATDRSYVPHAARNSKPIDNGSGPSGSTYHNNNNQQEKQGLGLMRLLQFSGILSNENVQKHQLNFWDELIKEYFTPKAVMRLTLWKDNQKIEAKPFGEYIFSLWDGVALSRYLFIRDSRYCRRNRRTNPAKILSGYNPIWRQVYVLFFRLCKREGLSKSNWPYNC